MKFIAKHTIVLGKPPNLKELAAGDPLPKMPADELMRLQDLGAITAVEDAKAKADADAKAKADADAKAKADADAKAKADADAQQRSLA